MRALGVLVLAAIAVVLGAVDANSASAYTPTPSPAPTVAEGSALVTIRHLYGDAAYLARIDHRIHSAIANGHPCGLLIPADVQVAWTVASTTDFPWPPRGSTSCNQINTRVQFCVPGGLCSDEATFTGEPLTVDMQWQTHVSFPVAIAHFRRDGAPQTVTIDEMGLSIGSTPTQLDKLGLYSDAPVPVVADMAIEMPLDAGEVLYATFMTREFGEVNATFTTTGSDVHYDVIIPSAATASPTPPATPQATPVALPRAGGPPASASDQALMLFAALTGLFAGAFLLSRKYAR